MEFIRGPHLPTHGTSVGQFSKLNIALECPYNRTLKLGCRLLPPSKKKKKRKLEWMSHSMLIFNTSELHFELS